MGDCSRFSVTRDPLWPELQMVIQKLHLFPAFSTNAVSTNAISTNTVLTNAVSNKTVTNCKLRLQHT